MNKIENLKNMIENIKWNINYHLEKKEEEELKLKLFNQELEILEKALKNEEEKSNE